MPILKSHPRARLIRALMMMCVAAYFASHVWAEEQPESKTYAASYTVTITGEYTNILDTLSVDLPVPKNSDSQALKGSPEVHVSRRMTGYSSVHNRSDFYELVYTKPSHSPMLHVKLRNIELREPLTVSLRYTVTAHNREIDADQASKAVFRDYGSSIPNEYLKPETLVESENKEIMDAARRIFGGELPAKDRSVYKSARKIYDWVLAHASYKLNSEMRRAGKLWGALDLLHGGKGECGDFAALFIALCRRAGIASRPQVGFWTRTDNQMHVWAEFYVPHHGWVPVDPSMGKSDPNRYFGNIPDIVDRVVVSEAFDHMYLDKKYDLLQTYYYWYTYSGTPVKLTAKGVFSARRIK